MIPSDKPQDRDAAILDGVRAITEGTMAELTAASEEIGFELAPGPVPLAAVRELPMRTVPISTESVASSSFTSATANAETVIGAPPGCFSSRGSRISTTSSIHPRT